jgi:molybdenum cofactor cytidylyltransferase
MGQPKQLLPWGEKTLIEHQISVLMQLGTPIIVVLGAYSEQIWPVIEHYPVTIAVNDKWESGMGSSVACGTTKVELTETEAKGALITLVDQPLIPADHYYSLLENFEPGNEQIVASTSAESWIGVPVLFDKCYFSELKNLRGEKGAKSLIQQYPSRIKTMECNEIINDIDTLKTYQETYRKHFKST